MGIKRTLPLAGVGFVAVVLAAFLGGGSTPDSAASAAEVAAYYSAHSSRHFVVAVVLALAAPLAVVFATSVVSATALDDRRVNPWRFAVPAGASVAAALFLVSALIHFALADAGNQGVSGGGIRALNLLDADTWIGFNAGLGVLMLTIAGLRLRARASAPRWLGWSALILGVALFIPFAVAPQSP